LLALRSLEAAASEGEQERAMKDMRAAATMGSGHAQFFLGNRYQHGQGVPQDPDRARRYFGLCAAQGEAQCQYRLAALLYQMPERRERDYIRAIALFELAAEQNHEEAKAHAVRETAKLTESQRTWKDSLKQQLAPPQSLRTANPAAKP
jgi:TPR repeat protein